MTYAPSFNFRVAKPVRFADKTSYVVVIDHLSYTVLHYRRDNWPVDDPSRWVLRSNQRNQFIKNDGRLGSALINAVRGAILDRINARRVREGIQPLEV